MKWIVDDKLVSQSSAGNDLKLLLSPEGWKQAQPIAPVGGMAGRSFVAMSFNRSMNSVFELGISPAVTDCGLAAPIRIDMKEHNNQITDEMMAEIRNAEFVIADFTGDRSGVYYEAGFARGLRRPVIYCCNESDVGKLHFDTSVINHIV